MNILRLLFCLFARFLLSLRYRVTLRGSEKLRDPALKRRTLVIPNHPSLTEPISLAEANDILSERGLRGIMRIDRVEIVEAIPLLGTGKTDYKVLRKAIVEMG